MALATAFSAPVLNEALTTGINQGLQELVSQLLAGKAPPLDCTRALKYLFYGACVMTPANHYLNRMLESLADNTAKSYRLSKRGRGDVKIALGAGIGLPVNAALFTAAIIILLGQPLSTIPKAIRQNALPVTARFASVLVPAQLAASRGVIPPWLAPIALQGLAAAAGLSVKVQLKRGTLTKPPDRASGRAREDGKRA